MASYLKVSFVVTLCVLVGAVASAQTKPIVVEEQELKLPPSATDLATELPEPEAPVTPKAETEKVPAPAKQVVDADEAKQAEPKTDSPRKKGKKAKTTPAETMKAKATLVARLDEIETETADIREGNEALEAEMKDLDVAKPSLAVKQAMNLARIKVLGEEYETVFRELKKISSKEEREKLDEMRNKRDHELKESNRSADAFRKARVSGCSPEETKVFKEANTQHTDTRLWATMTLIIKNEGQKSITISDQDKRKVVEDLCPGGSVRVSQRRSWRDGWTVEFFWMAENEDGLVTSQTYYVNQWDTNWRTKQHKLWRPVIVSRSTPTGYVGTSRRSLASASDCENFPAWFKC